MNEMEHGREPERRLVTQQEAAEMIELWTRSANPATGELLDLRDVAEALHISDREATQLLAQVRREPVPVKAPLPKPLLVALYTLLALSLVVSSTVTYYMLQHVRHGFYMSEANRFLLMVASLWTFYWLVVYRRPILRALGSLARRLESGTP